MTTLFQNLFIKSRATFFYILNLVKKLPLILSEASPTLLSELDYREIREYIHYNIYDCRLADSHVRNDFLKLLRHILSDSTSTIYSRLRNTEHGEVINGIVDELLAKGSKQFPYVGEYELISIGRDAVCGFYMCEPETCKCNHWIHIPKEEVSFDVIVKYEYRRNIDGECWCRKYTNK